MTQLAQAAAQQVLESVPLVMRTIRAQFRAYRRADISVPQFRTMGYLDRHDGASLSDLAVHIGLTLPSMSKLVDGLVSRKLINRIEHSTDRRRVCLSLTAAGREQLKAAHKHTEKFLADRMAALSEEDLRTIARSMQLLRELFLQEPAEYILEEAQR